MLGDTWEWTATQFDGYPGFTAHPYREYSEVFFGEGYRVLRGGSWATRSRVATADVPQLGLPQRRQIFSGVRLAGRVKRAAQPDSTGSSAPSLTSVSASSAAGSESRTTPTPA